MLHSFRKRIEQYLQKITEQNQKQFGTKRMDCCKLNKGPLKRESSGTATSKPK